MSSEYILFCDESGQRDYGRRTDPYFVIAGIVVQADEAGNLEDEIKGLKRAFWGSPDVEIKSNWIRLPHERLKHYARPHHILKRDIDALVKSLYKWLRKAPICLLAGIVDKPMMQRKYAHPHYAGGVAYNMILQRYQKYLAKRNSYGDVVFDDPAGKSPGGHEWRDLLKKQHAMLRRYGCPYTRTQFDDIGSLKYVDSSESAFIQLADIVAYNTFRQFRDHGSSWEDESINTLPTYDYFAKILRLFDRGPNNVFSGYGIAKWPIDNRVDWEYIG